MSRLRRDAAALGFTAGPRLLRDIGEMRRRRSTAAARIDAPENERLVATLRHLWPADPILVADLERAGRALSARTDAGPAEAVLPDLQAHLDVLHELLARSQTEPSTTRLQVLASRAAQHSAFLADSLSRTREAYSLSAEGERLARESGDRNRLAEVFVDRADQISRRSAGPEQLAAPITLAEAAVPDDGRGGTCGPARVGTRPACRRPGGAG